MDKILVKSDNYALHYIVKYNPSDDVYDSQKDICCSYESDELWIEYGNLAFKFCVRIALKQDRFRNNLFDSIQFKITNRKDFLSMLKEYSEFLKDTVKFSKDIKSLLSHNVS